MDHSPEPSLTRSDSSTARFYDRHERSVARYELDDVLISEFEEHELSVSGDQDHMTAILLDHDTITLPRRIFPRKNPLDANMTTREFR